MATKKELIQAESFSRGRLLTAFVSGAPGGKELEPTKPLRAVIAGIALAVLVVAGSLIFGLIKPGLPDGWDNNTLLLAKDTGSRYVAIGGVLHPVLNTTSAQLIIPSSDFSILTVDESAIANVERGPEVGILGAPDSLPDASKLVQSGWASCVDSAGTQLTMLDSGGAAVSPTDDAVVATDGKGQFLIAGGHRYAINADESAAILRATGMDGAAPLTVTGRWLNLFTPGSALTGLTVSGGGSQPSVPVTVGGRSLLVGTVVHFQGTAEDARYVLTADGALAPLSDFAYQLYLLGAGAELGTQVEVSLSDLQNARADPVAPADWPEARVTPTPADARGACATLTTTPTASAGDPATTTATPGPDTATGTDATPQPQVKLALPRDSVVFDGATTGTVTVSPSSGALVRAVGTDATNNGNLLLIDSAGTAFPVPVSGAASEKEVLAQLGYAPADVVDVPQSWIALFVTGPALTAKAASSPPAAPSPAAG